MCGSKGSSVEPLTPHPGSVTFASGTPGKADRRTKRQATREGIQRQSAAKAQDATILTGGIS
jgi:hypothetical protein